MYEMLHDKPSLEPGTYARDRKNQTGEIMPHRHATYDRRKEKTGTEGQRNSAHGYQYHYRVDRKNGLEYL